MTDPKPRQWTWERPETDAYSVDSGHYTIPCDHVLIIYGDETDCDPGFWRFDDMPDAVAARIVCAWNAHEGMVKALERIAAPVSCGCNPCRGECKSANALFELEGRQEEALAALALAKEDAP